MAAKRKTSKLVRALEKDLQGERVIYRDFQEGKISVLRDNRDKYYSAVPRFRGRGKALNTVAVSVLVIAASLLYFQIEKSGEQGRTIPTWMASATSKASTAVQVLRQTSVGNKAPLSSVHPPKAQTTIASVEDGSGASPCMLKKSSYGTTKFSFDGELRFARRCLGVKRGSIYCWNDRKGVTHFSTTGFPENEYYSPNWVKY
ncbi:MAG TPA: hypothetical protein ENK84_10460 [Desulfobulbus sp.]|nr:hypothetical protein [Desulfobulbus sp.]